MSPRSTQIPNPYSTRLHLKRLGRLAAMHRQLNGLSVRTVELAILDEIKRCAAPAAWRKFKAIIDPAAGRGLTCLEEEGLSDEYVDVPDVHLLARALQIPPLMLDPARSRPVKWTVYVESVASFQTVYQVGTSSYGTGTEYRVPQAQLDGTENLAIVGLELTEVAKKDREVDMPAHSASHRHPGSEILYVSRGCLEMHFAETGLRCRLPANSVIHFDSTQDHRALNLSPEGSNCFIVRFYGPESDMSRRPVQWRRTSTKQEKDEAEVLDRKGLGDFLELLRVQQGAGKKDGRLSLSDLVSRASRHEYPITRSRMDRIQHGKACVRKSELRKLARVYGIEPMVLYSFLLPQCRPISAIAMCVEADTEEIHDNLLGSKVFYRFPRGRLSLSPVMVALLILEGGGQTRPNQHPGQEIVLPIEGRIKIVLEGVERHVDPGQYAHFFSGYDHRMINNGDEVAKLLVMRFPCLLERQNIRRKATGEGRKESAKGETIS